MQLHRLFTHTSIFAHACTCFGSSPPTWGCHPPPSTGHTYHPPARPCAISNPTIIDVFRHPTHPYPLPSCLSSVHLAICLPIRLSGHPANPIQTLTNSFCLGSVPSSVNPSIHPSVCLGLVPSPSAVTIRCLS